MKFFLIATIIIILVLIIIKMKSQKMEIQIDYDLAIVETAVGDLDGQTVALSGIDKKSKTVGISYDSKPFEYFSKGDSISLENSTWKIVEIIPGKRVKKGQVLFLRIDD